MDENLIEKWETELLGLKVSHPLQFCEVISRCLSLDQSEKRVCISCFNLADEAVMYVCRARWTGERCGRAYCPQCLPDEACICGEEVWDSDSGEEINQFGRRWY